MANESDSSTTDRRGTTTTDAPGPSRIGISTSTDANQGSIPHHNGRIGTFESLKIRDFRWLWLGTVFSSLGQWTQQVTLGWVVYDLTGSGAALGAINGMRAVAMLGLGPFTGVIIDRLDRKSLMMATSVFLMFASLALGFMLYFHIVELWHLFAFMFLFGVAQAFDQPLRSTVQFDLVPKSHAPNAVALTTAGFSVTRAFGPGAGGFLIAAIGVSGNFFGQSVTYLLSTITRYFIHFPPRRHARNTSSVAQNFAEGFRFVTRQKVTRTFVLMGFIPPLLLIPIFNALSPIYAKDVFHAGPSALGILVSAVGVGGVLGALFSASLGRFERRGVIQLVALMGFSAGLFAFSYSPNLWIGALFMFLAGFAEMIYMTTNQTLLQLSIPDELRGRVTSLLMMNMGLMPLGGLVAGIGSDIVGPQMITRIMAGIAAGIGVILVIAVPSVRDFKLSQAVTAGTSYRGRNSGGPRQS